MTSTVNFNEEVEVQDDNSDLGIEFFDDVVTQRTRPQKEDKPKGFARRVIEGAGELGVFGALGSSETGRHVARTGARIGESIAGIPGNIREVEKSTGKWLGDKARSAIGKEPLTEEQREFIEKQTSPSDWDLLGKLTEALPTSTDIREGVTRKYTGDYLEPQTASEAFADDVAQDFAALALPVNGRIPFAKALGSSLVANTGGEIAGAFLGEEGKNYTKLGLLFATGMIGNNQGGIQRYIDGLYDDMRSTIPAGARVSARNLERTLNRVDARLRRGDPGSASKTQARQKSEAIRDKIQGGEITVDELIALTQDTNEVIFGGRDIVRHENELYRIREGLHEATRQYGGTNAEFLQTWTDANQAYAATAMSRQVGNWVRKNIKPKDYIYAASALGLGGKYVLGGAATATALGVAGATAATAYSAEVMRRIALSPSLRRYYTNTVNSSLRQNTASFTRNIKMLNDGLEKSFKSEPFETIDFSEEEVL